MVEEKISKTLEFCKGLSNHESVLLHEFPEEVALAKLAIAEMEFPTTRKEEWKYTRTARITSEVWHIVKNTAAIDIEPFLIPGLDASVIVFVNGFYDAALSKIKAEDGIVLSELCLEEFEVESNSENVFDAIHTAYCTGVLSIDVSKNIQAQQSLHILHISATEKSMAQPLVQIQLEKSSELHVVESFVSTSNHKSFSNRHLQVFVESNASLVMDKIQSETDENFLMNEERVHIEGNGRFTINTLTIDGGWVRNNLHIELEGENIETNLHGLYLPRNKQHIDNHTKVNHRFPHCNSNELYKGMLNDQSTGVFNGKVFVQPDAQKTNAFQSNANILLSDDAQMNSKPELEIYADDVKCSHGSTTGQLDENALFYLKSRGLGEESAKKLLTTAFLNDVLDKVENAFVRKYVTEELIKRDLLLQ